MKWIVVDKSKSVQPQGSKYNHPSWKEQVRLECECQCIYCALHDNQFGGARNYHVEHYKPKSIDRFKGLKLDINNLYYCCGICNTFKGDDWPNDWDVANESLISYPDPSKYDYSQLFYVGNDYKLVGKNVSGKYIVNKLFLNRPQLVYERREYSLLEKYNLIKGQVNSILSEIADKHEDELANIKVELLKFFKIDNRLSKLLDIRRRISPYNTHEVSR
ncbi:hypothetical protein LJ737_26785 [Hymenobacter sp. 15J16-1T3B]|uniref:HNH endonuclease n=1 Tax=Hymenobacter sp. 15J16-1T3B TaxID=2886941 RepID=UPI001D1226B6|nr:HNH endonuclease [Hymenobacter sp. 15J16-1T3B]MCC3160868.1 hypothetical protein [Hymenobacter sp. 15J16-1T3B]